jgi:hypothetical protein
MEKAHAENSRGVVSSRSRDAERPVSLTLVASSGRLMPRGARAKPSRRGGELASGVALVNAPAKRLKANTATTGRTMTPTADETPSTRWPIQPATPPTSNASTTARGRRTLRAPPATCAPATGSHCTGSADIDPGEEWSVTLRHRRGTTWVRLVWLEQPLGTKERIAIWPLHGCPRDQLCACAAAGPSS